MPTKGLHPYDSPISLGMLLVNEALLKSRIVNLVRYPAKKVIALT